jgi:subtilisin-like proprotein convertase family protein
VIHPSATPWFRSLSSLALITFLALAPQIRSQTFSGGAFSIPDSGAVQNQTVSVSAVSGTITTVTVTLNFSSSVRPDDMEFLLVHPDGTSNLEFLSDGGGNSAIGATAITLSDSGATCVPDAGPWVTGTTYKPADYSAVETGTDFGLPALTMNHAGSGCSANGTVTFAVAFGGLSANGTWHLYARDDTNSGDAGAAVSSWSITITAQSATASVGNFVFNDLNGNGIQDAGEPGIDGVSVQLLNSPSLTVAASTTTAGGGLYSFTGVAAGNYVLQFTAPAGFAFSPKDQGGDDTIDSDTNTGTGRTDPFALAGGDNDTTRDCGMTGTYVGNFVFGDTNHNGVQDAGETGIDGVTVHLLNSSNAIVGTTTTAGGGFYSFFVTPAGTYSIEFVLPTGFTFSPQDQGGDDTKDSDANTATGRTAQFTVTSGVIDNTRDAGMFATGVGTYSFTSTGITINDTGSGTASPYPSTLSVGGLNGVTSKVTVTVTGFSDPRPDDVDMLLVGPNGASLIIWSDVGGNSPSGTVNITLDDAALNYLSDAGPLSSNTFKPTNESTAQDSFAAPAPAGPYGNPGGAVVGAGADSLASKFNSTNPNGTWSLYIIDDATGAGGAGSITSWSLNVTTQASTAVIGDRVFEDQNGNGIQNGGEPGIDGVTVRLLNSPALTTAATTTTAGGGLYQFTNVAPGNYVVEFVATAGYSFAPKDQGGDDTTDSDANSNGRTDPFAVVAGQIDSSRDAGLVGTFVGDKVFGDLNHNGIQDAGETGIDGVTVRLRNSSDAIVGTTTTAGGGFYRFVVATSGTYSVEFVLPSGYSFSPQDQGADDTLDSDANTSTGRTVQFTVTGGQTDSTRDAGMFATSVGPLTFQSGAVVITDHDVNNNGTTASPYPSTISVGGRAGNIAKVRVAINGLTAARPDDVDMLLVGPTGASLIISSDVGGTSAGGPVTITLDDAAANFLSDAGALSSGTFKPTNEGTIQDAFSAPAPAGPYGNPGGVTNGAGPDTFASKFNGSNPNGTWSLYVLDDTVSGDTGASMTSWSLEITTAATAPAFTSANNTTFTVGTAGSFTVSATGVPAPTIGRSGTLPSGVTFVDNGNGTGTLSGMPAVGSGGTYPITFTATNGAGSPSQSFTLTVNEAPTITSANNVTFVFGAPDSFTVTTTGDLPMTINEAGALPSGITFTDNGNGTGTLSGTATASGTFPITFTASNGVGSSAAQSFTLTVNRPPSITSASNVTFVFGAPDSFTVTTTGVPTPAINETGALPSGITFTDNGNGTGTLSGTATASGTFPITITASNGVGSSAVQSFILTVNQAPSITSASSTTFVVGTAGTFTVTTGPHSPAAETISQTGALPSGVTFVDNGNGTATLSGTPGAGTGGSYPITITASNGVAPNATQSFTLTVKQVPAITSANATTFTVGSAGTFTVTTTGSSPMTLGEAGALPSGVTFVDNGNGTATLSGTPAAGTDGTYNLLFTASNGVSPDATQNFTLTVNPAAVPTPTPCVPPPANLVNWWPGEGNARDIWGNHNGTLENGAITAAGEVGQAFSLDGVNDYVDVGDVDLPVTFTIDAWINPASLATAPYIFTKTDGSTAGYQVSLFSDGTLILSVANGVGGSTAYKTTSPIITTGTWQHVAATYDGNAAAGQRIKLFVNGASVPTVVIADDGGTPVNNAVSTKIGIYGDLTNGPFSGLIDEVQVYNRALTQPEIQAIYDAGSGGNCKPIVYVSNTGNSTIEKFDTNGTSSLFSNSGLSTPYGLAFDGSGNLYTANYADSTIEKFDANGVGTVFADSSDGMAGPFGLAFDRAGNLYVANVGNSTIQMLDPSGAGTLFANTGLNQPYGLAFDQFGNLFVSNFGDNTIEKFTSTGNAALFADGSDGINGPIGLAFDAAGNLYVANYGNSMILKFNSAGTATGSINTDIDHPYGLAFDKASNLYVVNDAPTPVIEKFDSNGTGTLFANTGLNNPSFIAIQPSALPTPAPTPPERQFVNISSRASVGTGDNVAIGGFIIHSDAPPRPAGNRPSSNLVSTKRVLIRGIGPSLSVNGTPVTGRLLDPVLELHDQSGAIIATNDDWKVPAQNQTDVQATGLPPSDDHESAIVVALNVNANYTAILRGKNGTSGIGLVEVYDLEPLTEAHLANISTRAFVSINDDVLIGGIIVRGGAAEQILFRAMGPSLANSNVSGPLLNPQLDIHDAQGTLLMHNDNWKDSQEVAITATGLAPSNNAESAILMTPAPGNYTAIVSGVGSTTGVGLVEAYRLGPPTP